MVKAGVPQLIGNTVKAKVRSGKGVKNDCKTLISVLGRNPLAFLFDEKSVRVARTLNLIAGDGQTNVLHLNTLDYDRWSEIMKDDEWTDTYNEGWKKLKKRRTLKDKDQEFTFDILLANPPFAGEIKENKMLTRYELGKKDNGKYENSVSRHILFIERNLQFLKPGGRMAVVLPQGVFNNASEKRIRNFIAERCRILAVVGLHGNTFKPHTGTKTSVLFVQKWDETLCPKMEDYPIFFATQTKPAKDNSGDKIYVKDADGKHILDSHQHLITDHDLFNHDGKTQPGIAEAFAEFAKKEQLSFFAHSPFNEKFYQELLDGLEISVLRLSEVKERNHSFRYDSEFFRKEYIYNINHIKSKDYYFFGEVIKIITGGATPLGANYPDEGIPFLRVQNIMQNYFNLGDVVFISKEDDIFLKRSKLKINDILLTITGVSYGKSAVVTSDIAGANINQHSVKMSFNTELINPYFVSTFLNCKQGKMQSDQNIVGVTRPALDYESIKNFIIPKLSNFFQSKVESCILQAYQIENHSHSLYAQAERLLLEELGL